MQNLASSCKRQAGIQLAFHVAVQFSFRRYFFVLFLQRASLDRDTCLACLSSPALRAYALLIRRKLLFRFAQSLFEQLYVRRPCISIFPVEQFLETRDRTYGKIGHTVC